MDAETRRHIGAVAAPVLEPEEAERLAEVALAAGHEDEVVAAVLGWLARVA